MQSHLSFGFVRKLITEGKFKESVNRIWHDTENCVHADERDKNSEREMLRESRVLLAAILRKTDHIKDSRRESKQCGQTFFRKGRKISRFSSADLSSSFQEK